MWASGSVTFLLLDNLHSQRQEISTATGSLSPDAEKAEANLRAQLREVIARHGGHEFGSLRADSIWTLFRTASDALSCALAIRRLTRSYTPFNAYCGACRMALDTGDGGLWEIGETQVARRAQLQASVSDELMESGIKRAALDRALSVLQAGHPGQTLCSEVTGVLLRRELEADVTLEDLGAYRLHDAPVPERIYQLSYAGLPSRNFPALLAPPLHSGSLPASLTTFFGRERELQDVAGPADSGSQNQPCTA